MRSHINAIPCVAGAEEVLQDSLICILFDCYRILLKLENTYPYYEIKGSVNIMPND